MDDIPDAPFIRGKNAAIEGQPITANPYPSEQPRDGDAYPGPYHNWRAGWINQMATMQQEARRLK